MHFLNKIMRENLSFETDGEQKDLGTYMKGLEPGHGA